MKILYWMVQCTWGGLQTFAGLLLFLKYRTCRHQWFYGSVHTEWEDKSGISLGMFIFTPTIAGKEEKNLLVHEYGHTFQSLMLGPFYCFVIGIPSIIWCRSKRFQQLREKKGISYYSFYTEKWADWLGETATRLRTSQ